MCSTRYLYPIKELRQRHLEQYPGYIIHNITAIQNDFIMVNIEQIHNGKNIAVNIRSHTRSDISLAKMLYPKAYLEIAFMHMLSMKKLG